ncbi:MAG: MBOAT family protein [Polyangiaceae bacterium]|jgi:D-alanyl-lipoteichoic acid acyltransferase DltB (MBOAT superfamily)
MLFNSPLYGAFLVGTWAVFWLLRSARVARTSFLVVASYAFYAFGTWDAAREEPVPLAPVAWAVLCLAIIFIGSTLDYFVGRALGRVRRVAVRNALLVLSVTYYVAVLGIFKYWNFAAESVAAAFTAVGLSMRPTHMHLVLPFGISFFTFETVSYTVDVWRGELAPARRYLDYLLFVCFFPHLVAGPIVRPAQMLPQLGARPKSDAVMQARGLFRIAVGLSKKALIGDYLAHSIVDRVFATPERYTALEVLLAVYAFAAQIYADFSGYTDVAIGSAALFGYALPENFDAPYLSQNLQDFWRRWHISLSQWLRDYLYKPLGGSRRGSLTTYRNLIITMVLGGLWHGASWTFVVWGALHGGALALTRVWQRAYPEPKRTGAVCRAAQTIATFHFVCLAWLFFRAPTLSHAALGLHVLRYGAWSLEHLPPRVAGMVVAGLILHSIPREWSSRVRDVFVETPALVQGMVLAVWAMGLHFADGAQPGPFVYGQF